MQRLSFATLPGRRRSDRPDAGCPDTGPDRQRPNSVRRAIESENNSRSRSIQVLG